MNLGLALMIALSLLPVGLAQTWASVEHGLWYARSADFLQLPWMVTLRWLRIVGDSVFLAGTLALVWFLLGLWLGWSYEPERKKGAEMVCGFGAAIGRCLRRLLQTRTPSRRPSGPDGVRLIRL